MTIYQRIKKINPGYFFITPFILGFLIFGLYPVVNTVYLSFTNTTLMTGTPNSFGLITSRTYSLIKCSSQLSGTPGSCGF